MSGGVHVDPKDDSRFQLPAIREAMKVGKFGVFYEMWSSHYNCERHVWRHLKRIQRADEERYSPLHLAVLLQDFNIVKAILHGRDASRDPPDLRREKFEFLHARTSKGWTALHLAVVSGNEKMLELLMGEYDSVARPQDLPWNFADCCWMTPLHYAVLANGKDQMKLLLGWELYGPHVNARDYFQRTPLHMAACHRPVSVEHFVEVPCDSVDFNAIDCVMHSPLNWAISFGREEVVKCLVTKLRTVESFDLDIEGRSALEMALHDVVVNLNEVVRQSHPQPGESDKTFLTAHSYKMMQGQVSTRIRSQLLTIPAVKSEVERSHRRLQIYLNATNSALVVAALIANASFGRSPPDLENVDSLRSPFFFARALAFYTSIMALVAGFLALHSLGQTLYGGTRLKEIIFALRRISVILGIAIGSFLAAFFFSNWTSLSYLSDTNFGLFQTFSSSALVFCFLAALVMPISRGAMNLYEEQLEDMTDELLGILKDLVSRLYPEDIQKSFYWDVWQRECARTNVIKAYSLYRTGTAQAEDAHISTETTQAEKAEPENTLMSSYEGFVRDILNNPKSERESKPFSPPSIAEACWMWIFDKSRHVQKPFLPLYVIMLAPLWQFSGRDFRIFVVCSLFGDHFAETYCHGKLYRADASDAEQHSAQEEAQSKKEEEESQSKFAEEFWAKRHVPKEIMEGFKRMEVKIKRIERVYENRSESIGDTTDEGEQARRFVSFLDRLPRGIFYWINIWFFPKSRCKLSRGFFYWMNFWATNHHILPQKFPIVTFYQGYVFQRDFEKSREISREVHGDALARRHMTRPEPVDHNTPSSHPPSHVSQSSAFSPAPAARLGPPPHGQASSSSSASSSRAAPHGRQGSALSERGPSGGRSRRRGQVSVERQPSPLSREKSSEKRGLPHSGRDATAAQERQLPGLVHQLWDQLMGLGGRLRRQNLDVGAEPSFV